MPITCQRCACREKGTHLFSFCVTLMPPARPVSCHIDSKSDRARRRKGCKKGLQGVRNGLKTLCNGLKTRAANEFYTVKAGCFGALSLLLPESRGALRFKVNVPPACLHSLLSLLAFPPACLPSCSACLPSPLGMLAFPAQPAYLSRSACFPANPSTPYCIQRLNISPCHGKNQRSD